MAEFHSKWLEWEPAGKTGEGYGSYVSAPLARSQKYSPDQGSERGQGGLDSQKRPSMPLPKLTKPLRDPATEPHGDPGYFTLAGLKRVWAPAWTRAQEGFAEHGISPIPETLNGAAVLELWIADSGSPRPGLGIEDPHDWTHEIYRGRGSARVGQNGRVVLRALPDPKSEARNAIHQGEQR